MSETAVAHRHLARGAAGQDGARRPARPTVTGVAYDSRRVAPGELLRAPCLASSRTAARFVADAVGAGRRCGGRRGRRPASPGGAAPRSSCPRRASALARLADAYRGPSSRRAHRGRHHRHERQDHHLAALVEALLRAAGSRTGVIGTIQYRVGRAGGGGRARPRRRPSSCSRCWRGWCDVRRRRRRPWKCPRTRWRSPAWTASSSTWRSSPT